MNEEAPDAGERTPALRDGFGRWRPGQSGNVSGRPAVVAEVRALAAQHTVACIATLAEIAGDASVHPLARILASRTLLERAHGRPRPEEPPGALLDLARVSDADLELEVRREAEAGRAARAGRRWVLSGPLPRWGRGARL